jgi:hypothetical protein
VSDNEAPLASPYYDFPDVFRHENLDIIGGHDPFELEDFRFSSFSAMAILHLLIRANLKQSCKVIWPDFTRLSQRTFMIAEPWQYGLIHSEFGIEMQNIVPPIGQWLELQETARECRAPEVPLRLRSDPVMLLLFVIIAPQRLTPSVARFLGRYFSDVWFLPASAMEDSR